MDEKTKLRNALAEMYVAGVGVRRPLSQEESKEILAAWKCGYDAKEQTPNLHAGLAYKREVK